MNRGPGQPIYSLTHLAHPLSRRPKAARWETASDEAPWPSAPWPRGWAQAPPRLRDPPSCRWAAPRLERIKRKKDFSVAKSGSINLLAPARWGFSRYSPTLHMGLVSVHDGLYCPGGESCLHFRKECHIFSSLYDIQERFVGEAISKALHT